MTEPTESVSFNDVLQAINQLRRAFIKNGMPAPISIELADHESVNWFRYSLPTEFALAQPRMGETREGAEWVANIMGMEVRMKAQWRADRGRGSTLV
jgi:hypothetical protein